MRIAIEWLKSRLGPYPKGHKLWWDENTAVNNLAAFALHFQQLQQGVGDAKWTRVTDMLPPDEKMCWVAIKVDPKHFDGHGQIVHEMKLVRGYWYDSGGEDLSDFSPGVTHWRYKILPSPPPTVQS